MPSPTLKPCPTEPSPRPWRANTPMTSAPWKEENPHIYDAKGVGVAIVGIGKSPDVNSVNAALIVAAVNERDRLRDIVRNAVETLEQVYKHADMTDALREVVVEAQREACAALGEDKT